MMTVEGMPKLNLGCGKDYQPLMFNVDSDKNVQADLYHDLNHYPYPFKDNSINFIRASHVIEHLDNQMKFMEECSRILQIGGVLEIECPIGGTWSSYHLNHKYNLTPYSFKIFEQEKWKWEFPFKFKIEGMWVQMPILNQRVNFPWRLIYVNCFVNNVFTKMKVRLIK